MQKAFPTVSIPAAGNTSANPNVETNCGAGCPTQRAFRCVGIFRSPVVFFSTLEETSSFERARLPAAPQMDHSSCHFRESRNPPGAPFKPGFGLSGDVVFSLSPHARRPNAGEPPSAPLLPLPLVTFPIVIFPTIVALCLPAELPSPPLCSSSPWPLPPKRS